MARRAGAGIALCAALLSVASPPSQGQGGPLLGSLLIGGSAAPGPPSGLQITTGSIGDATIGSAYAQTLSASGGTGGGYSWTIVSAYPNNGLWHYVTPSGTASGTPQYSEVETVTYQVTDSGGNTAQKTFTFSAAPSGSLSIVSPTSLPDAVSGGYYAYHLIAEGGIPPYNWTSSNAAQPCNVTWDGWVECTPTSNRSIIVTVTDSYGSTATQTETITVGSTLTLAGKDSTDGLIYLPPANNGQAYEAKLNAYGGSGTGYAYSVTSGLPSWASISGNTISGTPTVSGSVNLTVKVTDSSGNMATATALLAVQNSAKVNRPSYNSSASNGFFQLNGKVYDPNGYPFTIHGANQLHYDSDAASGLPNTFANAVRIWDGNCTASNYTKLLSSYVADGIFPIATVAYVPTNSTTCSSTATNADPSAAALTSVVGWWVSNESAFSSYMSEMAINIANEWSPNSSATWESSYETAITDLRNAGYTCPIIIDADNDGQNVEDIIEYGQAIEQTDSLRNVIFSYHSYGATNNRIFNISAIARGSSTTSVTIVNNSANNPFCYPGDTGSGCYSGISAYYISGVRGMTQINGIQPAPSNVYGSQGSWTVTLNLDSSSFSNYTGGGTIAAFGNAFFYYDELASQFAALAANNVAVIYGEFGPGTDGSTGTSTGIGPSPTTTSFEQTISSVESYGLAGWIEWSIDDNNESGGNTSWANWFGQTTTGPGTYVLNTPSDLTAAGLDGVLNPRYGYGALASPAAYLQ